MRGLSVHLGVEAMSLYHYVRNREDLLDGLAERIVAGIPAVSATAPWADTVRAFCVGIRDVAMRHPRAFQLVGMRPLTERAAMRLVEPLLLSLRDAGLDPQECMVAYRLLAAFARGFSLARIVGFTMAGDQPEQESGPTARVPPTLSEFVDALAEEPDKVFEQGLEMIIAGIGTRLADW